jgi:hypothetical protein
MIIIYFVFYGKNGKQEESTELNLWLRIESISFIMEILFFRIICRHLKTQPELIIDFLKDRMSKAI